jgi:hypothetical protein
MDVEEFAIAFAVAVTEVSDPAVDLVAKKGKYSIFSILQGIFPQASAINFRQVYLDNVVDVDSHLPCIHWQLESSEEE